MNQQHDVDIRKEMAACVREIGGVVLEDELGQSPSFANADYLFRAHDTVAELKCMEKDTRSEQRFVEQVTAMHRRWVRNGIVRQPPVGNAGRVVVNSSDIPKQCSMEIMELLRTRIQRLVKKANQQIGKTKAALELDNAKGLLLLANDGDMMFELEVVLHLLDRIFKAGGYSNVNTVVYFTVNHSVESSVLPMPAQVWTDLVIDDGGGERESVSRNVLDQIKDGWFKHISAFSEAKLFVFDRSDESPDKISGYRFKR